MAEFYSARGWGIPPLPWTNLSPPFSDKNVKGTFPVNNKFQYRVCYEKRQACAELLWSATRYEKNKGPVVKATRHHGRRLGQTREQPRLAAPVSGAHPAEGLYINLKMKSPRGKRNDYY